MSYLRELEKLLGRPYREDEVLLLFRRAAAELVDWRGRAIAALKALDGRIDLFEERLLIVDTLPAEAPFGALIRLRVGTVAERASLYLGNGPGQPLSKITPTPL